MDNTQDISLDIRRTNHDTTLRLDILTRAFLFFVTSKDFTIKKISYGYSFYKFFQWFLIFISISK